MPVEPKNIEIINQKSVGEIHHPLIQIGGQSQ